ncbi:hypothetical protein EN858_24195 [Mesorhizobium sp. M4B.F.Ca.ET.215.01.1.1]|uniref:hypothetical protein n=1 Tax=unclassified Mesorhizobium TaxID=325217 RepID=UPI000FCC5B7B|nr:MULTISPECIES: hypothetical protein [unclassified Mesorhizobium]RUW24227.1 hypothetical protein EOA34_15735 [Mesorhizobium sp. M4B.F.Ca.ET.013.02.1.1]RVD42615.1 hypothetical protein EN741_11695 [Mesorhizobium sp. M4B.F.Ca.ET.019.03.1.1]RWF62963.1 MAG: hypothetical protein EOS47_21150 [Mesorhizobium sp.]TGQ07306.1 hypothetical protein EN858_24195 [Mesorhizobium sp. M4B.F.Ca.ET.215.01.1.1]TGQ35400.1 hypothetical protein EN863_031445 [Mesorhizobium sp. M00.F.Ca.ET.220.01.1.1]
MTSTTLARPEKFQIGKVLNNSFAVINRNIGLCLGLAALFSGLPTFVFQFWNEVRMGGLAAGDPAALAMADPATMFRDSMLTLVFAMLYFILSLLLQSALVRATIDDMNGKKPTFGDCIQIALRCLLPTIGIGLMVALGAGLASIALLVPGIILWLGWSVAVPALVQERLGVFGSMSRSRALTKGSRWALFGLFLILILIAFGIQMVLGTVVLLFGGYIAIVLGAVVSAFMSTLMSIASAVTYVELRQVKEGTSVEDLAEIFS